MAIYTHTEAGKAIITHRKIAILEGQTNGSIALGILLNNDTTPSCWCLFWEWGGDWSVFSDGQERDAELLDGWEPDAIREAIAAAVEACPECEADMEWFSDWADTAEETLTTR